ncbi:MULTISPECIES: DsrE family protein [unclassified Polynucleobacter]|uniref:DsrE family protein n=1 Tax=unclassified Polynucleobacter TaxID=2640945 RepID=UPI0008ABE809|nr:MULTISPECIES: DsrE family protein [unclassified Polynucleobacter]OHC09246.1 MAG: hypothetical protein A2X74_07675 [Polynucleobacter sp. GWA2_45_21]HBK44069.1 hypothetical protein [Polynucleobacter sp.]
MKKYLSLAASILIACSALVSQQAFAAGSSVVYHIDDADTQGIKGLRNVRNHMDVAPDTKIIVVTHANGVDIMMEGARDKKNNIEYAPLVGALKSRGVRFEVCEITLKNRNLKKDQFILDTDFTPSGVARIGDLQFKDHFAYIKP